MTARQPGAAHGRHLPHACRPAHKDYVAKKTARGHAKLEIIRCLKRYLARELYYLIRDDLPNPAHNHVP